MPTPGDMLDALEALRLPEIVVEAIEEKKEEYVKLNLEQLYEGLNPEGEKITPEYKQGPYRRKKARMNAAPGEGTPDFYLSASMYEQTTAEVDEQEIEIGSSATYAQYNEQRWGNREIWGLDPENKEKFIDEELRPAIIEKVSELTGLI